MLTKCIEIMNTMRESHGVIVKMSIDADTTSIVAESENYRDVVWAADVFVYLTAEVVVQQLVNTYMTMDRVKGL